MRILGHAISAQIKAGYVVASLFLPVFCLVVVSLDAIRAVQEGISILAAIETPINPMWVFYASITLAGLTLLGPAAIAPWAALSRGTKKITAFLRTRGDWVVLVHLGLSLLASLGVVFCFQLRSSAGFGLIAGEFQPSLHSWYLGLLLEGPSTLWVAIVVFLTVIGGTSILFGWPKTKNINLRQYVTRLELSSVTGRLVPLHGRKEVNLNSGSIAPAIKGIYENWRNIVLSYHKIVSGSFQARDMLVSSWSEAKELLKWVGVTKPPGMYYHLLGNTSRALEISVQDLSKCSNILLSPYEHPSESIAVTPLGNWKQMHVQSRFFDQPWEIQKKEFVDWVASSVIDGEENLLVISEVAYLTGFVLPVEQLVKSLRSTLSNYSLKIVIDGAHAVGNLAGDRPIDAGDAYIFSGHKWLLSPEPCGIVISHTRISFHDTWLDNLPSSSVGPSRVSALLGALRFRTSLSQEILETRVQDLKLLLIENLKGSVSIVGSSSGLQMSNLVTIRVHPGYGWIGNPTPEELQEFMASRGYYVTCIQHDNEIWIRVTINFFLDWRALSSFCKSLQKSIVPL